LRNAVRVFLPKCWFDAEKMRARHRRAQALPRRIRRQAPSAAAAPGARHSGFYRRIDYPPHGVV
jgi:hypothetical protein